jgi:uncharacterized RDD family membrane protein YckC
MSSTAVPTTASDKAGFWIRVGAYLIDAVILFVVNAIVGFIFRNNQGLQSLIELIVSLAYFVYFWSASGGGQTVGMRALKIKVVKTDGSQLDYGGAVIRYIGLIISFLVIFIGVIWVAFDANKQGWHDKIASTYVVRA